VARSDDEESRSKNINYFKVSLDDPFKDSKKGDKKFVELIKSIGEFKSDSK